VPTRTPYYGLSARRTSNEWGSVMSICALRASAADARVAVMENPRWPLTGLAHRWLFNETGLRTTRDGRVMLAALTAAVTLGLTRAATEIARTTARSAAIVLGVSTRLARATMPGRRRVRGSATCSHYF